MALKSNGWCLQMRRWLKLKPYWREVQNWRILLGCKLCIRTLHFEEHNLFSAGAFLKAFKEQLVLNFSWVLIGWYRECSVLIYNFVFCFNRKKKIKVGRGGFGGWHTCGFSASKSCHVIWRCRGHKYRVVFRRINSVKCLGSHNWFAQKMRGSRGGESNQGALFIPHKVLKWGNLSI